MIWVPYIKNSPNMLFIPITSAGNIAEKCTEYVVWVNKDPFEWLQFKSYLVRIFFIIMWFFYIVLWMIEQSMWDSLKWISSGFLTGSEVLEKIYKYTTDKFWAISSWWSTKSIYHSEDNGREALWRLVAETKIIKWYPMLRESNKSKYNWNLFDSKFTPKLQHAFFK